MKPWTKLKFFDNPFTMHPKQVKTEELSCLISLLRLLVITVLLVAPSGCDKQQPDANVTDPYILNDAAFAIASKSGAILGKEDLQRMLDMDQRALKYSEGKMVPKAVEALSCLPEGGGSPFLIMRSASGDDHALSGLIEENIEAIKKAMEEIDHK